MDQGTVKSNLNPDAPTFVPKTTTDPEKNYVIDDADVFLNFFRTLFQNWKAENVEYIVSELPVKNLDTTLIIFKELFNAIYKLSCQKYVDIRLKNVIETINYMDSFWPEDLMNGSKELDSVTNIIKAYFQLRTEALKACFENFMFELNSYKSTHDPKTYEGLSKLTEILSGLHKIRYYNDYVYEIGNFFWNIFLENTEYVEIRVLMLYRLSLMGNKIATFLLWTLDQENNKVEHRNFAVKFFNDIKEKITHLEIKYGEEMGYALDLLDKRDRFIGAKCDAIPENILKEGYIIGVSFVQTFETDDVYKDMENFMKQQF